MRGVAILETMPVARGTTSAHGAPFKDPVKFASLYEENVNRVYRHVYYLVGSRAEAEDITAQTFLQAWNAFERYQDRGKPIVSWLLTVAHNLVVSRFRNVRHEARIHDGMPVYSEEFSPEAACMADWQQQEIAQAILKLKATERHVILLRFVDNMDYTEVAQAMNKTVNAIRVIQYRALRNLRKILEDGEGRV